MSYFLLVYNRQRGTIEHEESFDDEHDALTRRWAIEREGWPDGEIVVLGAESREALMATHARYFCTLRELLAKLDTLDSVEPARPWSDLGLGARGREALG